LCADVARIDGRGGADIEPVAQHPTKTQVSNTLGQVDLAKQFARRTVAADPILLWITPADAAPDISLDISPHAISQCRRESISIHLTVGYLAGIDIDIEHTDMGGVPGSLGYAAVDDVGLLLVR
jgi:hypothetical protein